jgi:hypothetical protein
LLLDDFSSHIEQLAIGNARGAGGFAVSTGQAAIQMALGGTACGFTLKHLLDEVNPTPGTIKLIA